MNPIDRAVTLAQRSISRQTLTRAFIRFGHGFNNNQSIDSAIKDAVIYSRVIPDCNLVGGTQDYIDLSKCHREVIDHETTIYKIPRELTAGRNIVRAYALEYAVSMSGGIHTPNVNDLTSVNGLEATTRNALEAAKGPSSSSTSDIQLVTGNIIAVKGSIQHNGSVALRCLLENDSQMNNITGAAILTFSQLCLHAIKAHVYITLINELDEGAIRGGIQFGGILREVEGFADANELYEEMLEKKWRRVARHADKLTKDQLVNLAVGHGFH